jgi:hypothetical protein
VVIGLAFAGLVVFGGTLSAYASCTNPSPMPAGYAVPCPVFAVSPATLSQSQSLAISATPQAGTDYIYTTAYYAKGSTWLPVTLAGNNAAPSYSSGPAQGSLTPAILSTLTPGTNYIVLWDWLWDATAQCYKGPGLNQCNTGTWTLQTFSLTSSTQGSAVSILPTSLTFPSTQIGTTSPTEYATLTNNNTVTLNFIGNYAITGDFSFAGTGTCVGSVAPGGNCALSVKFTPTVAGTRTGQVSITDDAPGSPHTFTLSGTGTASIYTYSQSTYISGTCTTNCYYISPSGLDSNSGTSSGAPWKSFAHAIPLLNSGDTLNLLNGTYQPVSINCSSGAHNGTSSAKITIQALNERQAWIKGDGSNEPFHMTGCSYWNIIGLHISDGDFSGEGSNGAMDIQSDTHLLIKRNILDHDNRCKNVHLITLVYGSSNNQILENEVYYYHRHGIILYGDSNNNEVARNYSNSRHYPDGTTTNGCTPFPSGDTATGDTGVMNYGSSNNIYENNISENNDAGLNTETVSGGSSSIGNTWLGNISLRDDYGIRTAPHTTSEVATGLQFTNNVVVGALVIGSYMRQSQATISHGSYFLTSSTNNRGVLSDPQGVGGSFRQSVDNTQVVNGTAVAAYYADTSLGSWTGGFDHVNSFNNGSNFSTGGLSLTNATTQNPAFGSCYLWVPASSPLKGAGTNGSDIGANILYAYQGGILTNTKLWNTDGSFAGRGAIVPSLNDVAGSSLFDIQNRLNINKNGCAFPAGY